MKIALLLKLLPVALLLVLLVDGLSVGKAAYSADSEAAAVAQVATASFAQTKSVQQAYDAAVASLGDPDDSIDAPTFKFDQKGSVVLTLHRKAPTMVLGRVRDSWTVLTVQGKAGSPS